MDTLIDQNMLVNFCAVMDTLIDQYVVGDAGLGVGKSALVSADQINWSGLLHTKFCLLEIYNTETPLVKG